MKRIPIHKGGRPAISEGRRKKYLLSLRLDAEHYFKLKALVHTPVMKQPKFSAN